MTKIITISALDFFNVQLASEPLLTISVRNNDIIARGIHLRLEGFFKGMVPFRYAELKGKELTINKDSVILQNKKYKFTRTISPKDLKERVSTIKFTNLSVKDIDKLPDLLSWLNVNEIYASNPNWLKKVQALKINKTLIPVINNLALIREWLATDKTGLFWIKLLPKMPAACKFIQDYFKLKYKTQTLYRGILLDKPTDTLLFPNKLQSFTKSLSLAKEYAKVSFSKGNLKTIKPCVITCNVPAQDIIMDFTLIPKYVQDYFNWTNTSREVLAFPKHTKILKKDYLLEDLEPIKVRILVMQQRYDEALKIAGLFKFKKSDKEGQDIILGMKALLDTSNKSKVKKKLIKIGHHALVTKYLDQYENKVKY